MFAASLGDSAPPTQELNVAAADGKWMEVFLKILETRIIDKFGFQAVLTLTTAVRMSVAGRKARRTDTAFARDLRARASMPVHGTMDSRFIFFPLSSYYYLNFLELQLFGKDIKIS